MALFRSWRFALLVALVVVAVSQTAHSQSPTPIPPMPSESDDQQTCVVYSLSDLGDDPALGAWIAETVREVIEPGTWKQQKSDSQGIVRYFAPRRVMVVYHTPSVHSKVEGFLRNLKRSQPGEKRGSETATGKSNPKVVPVGYVPNLLKAAHAAPEPASGYPVPPQTRAPKHLFHFIIRYEGDGIVDDNIAKVIDAQVEKGKERAEACLAKSEPSVVPTPAAPVAPAALVTGMAPTVSEAPAVRANLAPPAKLAAAAPTWTASPAAYTSAAAPEKMPAVEEDSPAPSPKPKKKKKAQQP